MVANFKFSGCLSTTNHNSYTRIIMRKYAIVVAVLLTLMADIPLTKK